MTQAASPHGADVVCIASWNVDLVSHVPRPLAPLYLPLPPVTS